MIVDGMVNWTNLAVLVLLFGALLGGSTAAWNIYKYPNEGAGIAIFVGMMVAVIVWSIIFGTKLLAVLFAGYPIVRLVVVVVGIFILPILTMLLGSQLARGRTRR